MNNNITISNKQREIILVVIAALVSFSLIFVMTGAIMTKVYGIKPGDPDFTIYPSNNAEVEITPYTNFVMNGCFTNMFGDSTMILDTKGLEELGMPYYDPNTCMDIALGLAENGYIIDKVEPYKMTGQYGTETDQMKITLVKKP